MTMKIGRDVPTFTYRPCAHCVGHDGKPRGYHVGYLKTDVPGCFPGVVKTVESRTSCSACNGRGTIPHLEDRWGNLRRVRVRPRV